MEKNRISEGLQSKGDAEIAGTAANAAMVTLANCFECIAGSQTEPAGGLPQPDYHPREKEVSSSNDRKASSCNERTDQGRAVHLQMFPMRPSIYASG
jgi:hypothetical protein